VSGAARVRPGRRRRPPGAALARIAPDPLLEAAARYILEAGLATLSLRPLAAELDTSPRVLLYHFGSKESLLAEALHRIRQWQQQAASAWLAQGGRGDPAAALRRAWAWLTSDEAAPFMRLFFEVYGLAVQQYADFLEVVAVGRRIAALEETIAEIGGSVGAVAADISRDEGIEAVVAALGNRDVDAVVQAAGRESLTPLERTDRAELEARRVPLNRVADPGEVAATVVHLLLDATAVTGSAVPVDLGYTAR
jgi:AcrR family transcriptional regulator